MELIAVGPDNRAFVNNFLATHWFSTDMALRGELVDMTTKPGFLVMESGEALGLLLYEVRGPVCEVLSLDSLCPNQGVGTALLHRVEALAREQGCQTLLLVTTNDNLHALRFYQRHGFDMVRLNRNALEVSRRLKPSIPLLGEDDIPLRHEIELEMPL